MRTAGVVGVNSCEGVRELASPFGTLPDKALLDQLQRKFNVTAFGRRTSPEPEPLPIIFAAAAAIAAATS